MRIQNGFSSASKRELSFDVHAINPFCSLKKACFQAFSVNPAFVDEQKRRQNGKIAEVIRVWSQLPYPNISKTHWVAVILQFYGPFAVWFVFRGSDIRRVTR